MHGSALRYLGDVGYFTDAFQTEVLEQNVLPWLFSRVEGFVEEIEVLEQFPTEFLSSNLYDFVDTHDTTVKEERARKEAARQAVEEAEEAKQEDIQRRREAKEAAKKAAELKRLKEEIRVAFIDGTKTEMRDSILNNEVTEITGNHQRGHIVGALGGFLGQLIMVVGGAHKRAK